MISRPQIMMLLKGLTFFNMVFNYLTFLRSFSPVFLILSTCTHSTSSCMPHHPSLAYFSQHASMPPHHSTCMRKTHLNIPLCIIKTHMQHACMGILILS